MVPAFQWISRGGHRPEAEGRHGLETQTHIHDSTKTRGLQRNWMRDDGSNEEFAEPSAVDVDRDDANFAGILVRGLSIETYLGRRESGAPLA